MEHDINKTKGSPITQHTTERLFSPALTHASQFAAMDDGARNFRVPPNPDSLSMAVEILNSFAMSRMNKLVSGQSNREAPGLDSSAALDLQTFTQSFYGLTNGLVDSAVPDFAGISSLIAREKTLNGIQSTTPTTLPTQENVSGLGNIAPGSSPRSFVTDPPSSRNDEELHRLAHWSKALSATSPSAAAAFQRALAQMALLGLSSPTMGESTKLKSASSEVSNGLIATSTSSLEPTNLSQNNRMDIECNAAKNGTSMTNDLITHIPGSDSMQNQTENSSKVIIRQTADADEHFFKALRRLKVDVSAENQTAGSTHPMDLVMDREATSIGWHTHEASWDINGVSVRREQPNISKSATELAVEEHFEKSLAVFKASNLSKKLLGDKIKANSNGSVMRLPVLIDTQRRSMATTSINTPGSSSFDLHSITSHGQRSNAPSLVRQYAQERFSPQIGSTSLSTIESASFSAQNILRPESRDYDVGDRNVPSTTSVDHDNIAAPKTRTPFSHQQCATHATVATNSSANSGASAQNSFKPKKNWLAQYDWRQDRSDRCALSPNTHDGLDSMGSSPSSIGRDAPDPITTNNDSRWLTGSNHCMNKIFRGENVTEHEASVQTVESIGLSTDDRPFAERKLRHSAEIQTDTRLTQSVSTSNDEDLKADSQNSSDEAFSEQSRPRKILLLEKNDDVGASIRSPVDSNKCGDSSTQTGYHLQSQAKRNLRTLRKELALSPIFQNTGTEGTSGLIQSKSGEQLLIDLSNRGSPKVMEEESMFTNFPHTQNMPGENGKCEKHNTTCCSHWALSNSCSPSPAHQDGSVTSAVTPVSGTTSGFFTGSTYSLDSSLGTAHTMPFDTREADSGIDLKSASDERNFPARETRLESVDSVPNTNNADLLGYGWGLRKRASSEASPWSTLKRSRSVLTSPLCVRPSCASCSSSSAELILDDSPNTTVVHRKHLERESHCRYCEEPSRPFRAEANTSPLRIGLDCHQKRCKQHSSPHRTDSQKNTAGTEERAKSMPNSLPELYPIHLTEPKYDRKPRSEPPCTTTKLSGSQSVARSVSDAANLPKLHLTKENEIIIIR